MTGLMPSELATDCPHPETAVRRRTLSNGVTHIVLQCTVCGRQLRAIGKGDPLRAEGVTGDPFDEDLSERWWSTRQLAREAVYREEQQRRRAAYAEYLQSEGWRRKRAKRLAKDGHECQAGLDGCLIRATEVHHLTYDHYGDEPLFDLVSLCAPCHRRLSVMEGRIDGRESA